MVRMYGVEHILHERICRIVFIMLCLKIKNLDKTKIFKACIVTVRIVFGLVKVM